MVANYEQLIGSEHLDSRDIIEAAQAINDDCEAEGRQPSEEEKLFLQAVEDLENEVTDWEYGAHLIGEDHFEDYARELAEDIGAITGDEQWPLNCIDWERAANELRHDYSCVTFMGYDYLVRS